MQSRPWAVTAAIVVMDVVLIKQQGPYSREFKLVPWSLLSSDPLLTD